MMTKTAAEQVSAYELELKSKELAPATISKYTRDAAAFLAWANGRPIEKALTIDYKNHLRDMHAATSTLNNKIVTLNKFLVFIGCKDAAVKNVQVQPHGLDDVMSQNDYNRILNQAKTKGTPRDVLMLEALLRTGVRVSELEALTVEALKIGHMTIKNKGKERKVPITKTLDKQARAYATAAGIKSGQIITNAAGDPLSRFYIHRRIKWLAGQARVKKLKAYPHSIRHLFAKNYLARNGQKAAIQLSQILGHSSLETTKIYTRLSIDEARDTMD